MHTADCVFVSQQEQATRIANKRTHLQAEDGLVCAGAQINDAVVKANILAHLNTIRLC